MPSHARTDLPESDSDLLALAVGDRGLPAGPGLFAEGCWLRRVSGDSATLFGGGCALLLEVAHPLVAAGVAAHSRYREDPFGRLSRTLAAMSAIAFGDLADALAAARSVERAHRRVEGRLSEAVGPFSAGTAYHGRDPELVQWVWATLAWTARQVYERVAGPLGAAASDAYHAEHAVLARLLGVPRALAPETREAFDTVFDETVGTALAVGAQGRDVARFVLDPPPGVRSMLTGKVEALTTALLPERVRGLYRLDWDEARELRLERWLGGVRGLRSSEPGPAEAGASSPAAPDLDSTGPSR